jgi:hypothetical protein
MPSRSEPSAFWFVIDIHHMFEEEKRLVTLDIEQNNDNNTYKYK